MTQFGFAWSPAREPARERAIIKRLPLPSTELEPSAAACDDSAAYRIIYAPEPAGPCGVAQNACRDDRTGGVAGLYRPLPARRGRRRSPRCRKRRARRILRTTSSSCARRPHAGRGTRHGSCLQSVGRFPKKADHNSGPTLRIDRARRIRTPVRPGEPAHRPRPPAGPTARARKGPGRAGRKTSARLIRRSPGAVEPSGTPDTGSFVSLAGD
jgi:hypothetical protein